MDGAQAVPLDRFILKNPEMILGRATAAAFDNTLPFLFKVLAAAQPLSLQVHPDSIRAREGFFRENQAGIPLNSPRRNYRDLNHKPECLCALTPFSLLCGFRPLPEILAGFSRIFPESAGQWFKGLASGAEADGLKTFFQRLLAVSKENAHILISRAMAYAGTQGDVDPVCRWIIRLHRYFPEDIMILAPAFLHLLDLAPGQAIFLPSGVLHSYLEGVGIELMASSDNVLRGGLTSKHIDADELIRLLDFTAFHPRVLSPTGGGCEGIYETGAREFVLSVIRVKSGQSCLPAHQGRVTILLCTEGEAAIRAENGEDQTVIRKGDSVLIPASVDGYHISGDALIYKAAVPDPGGK
jgi:mannose-6-phosphate isomerase